MPVKKLEISGAAGLDGPHLTSFKENKLAAELPGILNYVKLIDEVDSIKIGHNIKRIFGKNIVGEDKAKSAPTEK